MEQVYWFYREADEEWHAYHLSSPAALCGKTAIAYNIDKVADAVPEGEEAHKACWKAIAKAEKDAAKEAE